MRRWAVLTAFALLSACSWPGGLDDIAVSPEGPLPAEALGRCVGDAPSALAVAAGPVLRAATSVEPWPSRVLDPGVWIKVERVDAAGARRHKDKEFPGRYLTVGGEPRLVEARPAVADRLRMDGMLAKAADAALRAGATVHLKRDEHGVHRLAVALRGDEYAFLGDCAIQEEPRATAFFGPYTGPYLRVLVDRSRAETLRILGYEGGSQRYPWIEGGRWRRLDHPYTPPDVLRALRRGTVEVHAPASWLRESRLCVLTYLGSSGCAVLGAGPAAHAFYYDPGRPDVTLVVRYRGEPYRLNGIDLAVEAGRAGLDLRTARGLRLTVTLAADPSLREVVARGVQTGSADAVQRVEVTAR